MTFINHMISQAKSPIPPDEFVLRPNQVHKCAMHMHGCNNQPELTVDQLERLILDGQVRMLGIPIRVIK